MTDRNSVAASRRARRGLSMGALALALMLVPAASAVAGQVDISGSTVFFSASNGEGNSIVAEGTRSAMIIRDSAGGPVTDSAASSGPPYFNGGFDDPTCTQDNASQVTCTAPANADFSEFTGVALGLADGNDSANIGGSLNLIDVSIDGGDGDDSLSVGVGIGDGFGFGFGVGGGLGNDSITGGRFFDDLSGDAGNDAINGGALGDTINGGGGNDTLNGENGGDSVNGSGGDDVVTGGPDGDVLTGGDGNDTVSGGDGNDNVSGENGADNLQGDANDDFVTADEDQVADTYGGGPGNDIIDYSNYASNVTLSLDGAANDGAGENDAVAGDFENGRGGAGDDTITGNATRNVLAGNSGADTISGLAGDDDEFGGNGNDLLSGGDGRDFLGGGNDGDTLNGEAGDDTLQGNGGADLNNGGAGVDTADYQDHNSVVVTLDRINNDGSQNEADNADADGAVENVISGGGDDSISGNALVNFIDSGYGNDLISVRDGSFLTDVVSCGPGYDVVAADALDAIDTSDFNRCENAPAFPITRVKPTLSVKVSPKTNRRFPKTFTVSGKVNPGAVPASAACSTASFVAISFKKGKNTISTRRVQLSETCTYSTIVSFTDRKRLGTARKLGITAVFSGNKFLSTASKKTSATIR